MDYNKKYLEWLNNEFFDEITREELKSIENDKEEIEDRFYKELAFGTAGLRGKIGAGTNRMNKYIISTTTQGLAEVIKKRGKEAMARGVAIAYDVRHYSDEFAKTAALVLAQNGIKAYLFEGIRPTPELSYTIRKLNAISGIVVTASHNPKDYNGYKVYWEEGSQILSDIANEITDEIGDIKNYSDVKIMDEKEALDKELLEIIGKDIDDDYIEMVRNLSLRNEVDKNIKIVYTPLNGTGNVPVRRVLREQEFNNIFVVPEQENPDPDFTTVGYPNPEDLNSFEYAIKLGQEKNADLLIATDPDCDRVRCMVKNGDGNYEALNGNQIGAILINYILEAREEQNSIPNNGAIVKSIVTGDLGKVIAKSYNVETVDTLTGFKNICGKANEFERTNEYDFIFGYEESIGYTYGTEVRDKDAVSASMLLCEAAAYYKTKNKTLLDILESIFSEYGYYSEKLFSLVLEGIEGQERIQRMMKEYRVGYLKDIKGSNLVKFIDFLDESVLDIKTGDKEPIDIPKQNAMKFILDDESWYAIRPSGTEPKIKIYIYSKGKSLEEAESKIENIEEAVMGKLNSIE
ncbi:phospho-sugar mutase [Sporosalibacterium faouarense]|uniref:phospho-sugar mutase n=1 Tax=Sporosalibacterium faouarense TaxID=516123 RepID=UPI00141C995B|nr:phospho-sugar mutase [Sporosalibacterium faouarense]MTI46914.1 phospho-sugar mutase [Bacillota bacterium]